MAHGMTVRRASKSIANSKQKSDLFGRSLVERVEGVEPSSSVWKTEIITAIRHPLTLLAIKIPSYFVAGPRFFFTVWLHTPQKNLPRASYLKILLRSHAKRS